MIRLENVSHCYTPGTPVLQSVTLQLRRGEVSILLGGSGAGKSTLLRCMNGLCVPTSGAVHADGIGDLADPRRRRAHQRRTGMVFQSHQLIGRLSSLANVLKGRLGRHTTLRSLFPPSPSEIRLALFCLDRVGLLLKAQVRADQLSGGERQRVGIARALVQQPEILLADEPVASLDPGNGEAILTLLHRICREDGVTLVLSLHQVEYARRFADRILGLVDGRLVFDGPPEAFTADALQTLYRRSGPRGLSPSVREEAVEDAR